MGKSPHNMSTITRLTAIKTRTKQLILSSLFAISLLSTLSLAEEPTTLSLGELSRAFKLKDNKEFKHFKIEVPNSYEGKKDLIIKVTSPDDFADPDVFISKKHTNPTSLVNAEWSCSSTGKETCAVSYKDIRKNDKFYVGVRCNDQCRFTVFPTLTGEIQLDDGVEMQLDFLSLESKIFRFYIPSNKATRDEQNQITSVTITTAPILASDSYILLTATTKQDQVPTTQTPLRGVPGWRKGKTLRISSNDVETWCTDCWVTILVDVMDPGKYTIMAKTNVGIMQLHEARQVDDIAFYGDRTCYKYFVQNEKSNVHVRLQQFSGMVSFTMNPKKPADDYESAPFKTISMQNSVLTLSPRERKSAKQVTGLYYMCVFPHMTATYSIVVKEIPSDANFVYIDDGYTENGEVLGKNMTLYVYKVPKLDFQGEDIAIEFQLTTLSGVENPPRMAVAFCDSPKGQMDCTKNLTQEKVFGEKSVFLPADRKGKDLNLMIDHDEAKCNSLYKGECYYVIGIQGQGKPEEYTQFSLFVIHAQQNHYILSEGQMVTDYVNLGSYRYFQFTLQKDPTIKNVTFRLNSLHGDADLYVSREPAKKFPNKVDYEKSSAKTNGMIDQVYFDGQNIDGITYYISVFSYQYSTFNLVAMVDRVGKTLYDNVPQLIEGISVKGSIHNEDAHENYKIQVKQVPGYEKAIKIQLSPIEGKFKFYVNIDAKATATSHIWKTEDNFLMISTKDKNFKRDATYYIAVYPQYSIWQLLIDNYYTYQISYTTQDTFFYLQTQTPFEHKHKAGTAFAFRHFLTQPQQDISISMTVFSGSPEIYISIDPQNKRPNATKNDYNSSNIGSMTSSKGKAVQIAYQELVKNNLACTNLALQDSEPCAIFAVVNCVDECKYSLKVSYELNGIQKIVVGSPQHDIIKDGRVKSYYLTVRQNKTKVIYSVLNSLTGNADLYVKFKDNPQKSSPDSWDTGVADYDLKSTALLGQDVIKIKQKDLQSCFDKADKSLPESERECAIIYGVYAPGSEMNPALDNQGQTETNLYNTRFDFVVYTDILQLMTQSPFTGSVEEGEFQYFFYEALCDKCNLIISLSTFANGDPDLYINFGDANLPTLTKHDIQSSTLKSEIVNINLENSYFRSNGIKSMKGPYIFGVYGNKKSTFTISVTEEKYPMTPLSEGMPLKISQEAYDVMYFLWYNVFEDKDFRINLNVKSGLADIYVSTFDDNDARMNLVSRLPKSKREAQWTLENVVPTAKFDDKELLIVNNERNYCSMCYYIIGVITHEQKSDYSLSLTPLDANFTNSQMLRLGEIYHEKGTKDQVRKYRFIIDEVSPLHLSWETISGEMKTLISFNEDGSNPVGTIEGSGSFKIDPKNIAMFKTEQMYYLITRFTADSEYTFSFSQERSITHASDGVPMLFKFTDEDDTSKKLTFTLPDGTYALQVLVKTKTPDFYPKLYIKYYEDLESKLKNLEFPPAGEPGFFVGKAWDYKLGILQYSEFFQNVKGGKAGLALNLWDVSNRKDKVSEAYITISTSSVIKMVTDNMYSGKLIHPSQYIIYQVSEETLKQGPYLMIEFSQCLGDSEVLFVESPSHITRMANVKIAGSYSNFGRTYTFIELPRPTLYILVRAKLASQAETWDEPTNFMIKVKANDRKDIPNINYHIQSEGHINWNFVDDKKSVNVTWGNIYFADATGVINIPKEKKYHLLATKNPRAKLDSACAMKNDIQKELAIATFTLSDTQFNFENILPNDKYYVNVIGEIETGKGEHEFVPYKPVEISVPQFSLIAKTALALYILIGVGLAGGVCYYWRKTKEIKQNIEFEMTDVRNVASVAGYARARDAAMKEGQARYTSLTSGGNGVNESFDHA